VRNEKISKLEYVLSQAIGLRQLGVLILLLIYSEINQRSSSQLDVAPFGSVELSEATGLFGRSKSFLVLEFIIHTSLPRCKSTDLT
jgi:hypothetical protein